MGVLAQEEDLLLVQEEDLLLAQEEDLHAQEEDLLLITKRALQRMWALGRNMSPKQIFSKILGMALPGVENVPTPLASLFTPPRASQRPYKQNNTNRIFN